MSDVPEFFPRLARLLNSGQSRSVVLCGNVHDLFWDGERDAAVIPFLLKKTAARGIVQVVYELNGPIRIHADDLPDLKRAWVEWKTGVDPMMLAVQELARINIDKGKSQREFYEGEFDRLLSDATGNPTLALEVLRQLTICSREALRPDLVIIIEAADMLLPAGDGDIARLNDRQLRRISIVQDWFGDPDFAGGHDSVVLIAESASLLHPRVVRMPQVLSLEIPAPDAEQRRAFIERFIESAETRPKLWSTPAAVAEFSAGLSIQSLRQMLLGSMYDGGTLGPDDVLEKVEEYIQDQLGEDVVEFKKPKHTLDSVVGASRLKAFIKKELLPRFEADGEKALPGCAIAGPIGSGKTFIFEAVAAELDCPVLVLKSIRSQWFGQTDVIFERLRRVLEALDKVVIFVDEADTQFGRVDAEAHATERRLTGKIQAMMSDPKLRGRVFWLLMTARIHLLSPDIRRPGRVGDLILPVLDPEGEDREAFIDWVLSAVDFPPPPDDATVEYFAKEDLATQMDEDLLPPDYSAAAFASLRSLLKAHDVDAPEEVRDLIYDQLPPAIGKTREYQRLQALINTTRRSLLPDPDMPLDVREQWQQRVRELEAMGVS